MIELKDINKVFKDKNQNEFYAAKDVNLKINDGEIFGIIGFPEQESRLLCAV